MAERHLGAIADQRYAFGDAAALHRIIEEAGFHDIQVRTVRRTIRFDNGEPYLGLNTMAYVGMSAAGKDMREQDRERIIDMIVRESAPVVKRYSKGSVLEFELSTNLATATG